MSDAVPLLRNRRFLALWGARTVSVAGDGFGRVALAFGVLGLPGSTPARLSLVLAAQALPLALLILPGGVIADRVSRARLMVAAELLAALSWLALTLLIGLRFPIWWLLTLCAFGAGTGSALLFPALTGLTPEVVPADRLRQANAWIRVGHNGALTLGMATSGMVVAAAGAGWALGLNAVSFLCSAGLLASLGHVPRPARDRRSPLADLVEGGREFFSHQWLWVIALQFALLIGARQAEVGVLGPLVAERSLGGARSWGFINGSWAAGMVLGALVATRVRVRHPMLVATLLTVPFALPMVLLAARLPVPVVMAGMVVDGMATANFGVLWETTIQRHVPAHKLSRVSSFDILLSLCLAPLGLFVAGPAAARFGPERVLWVCAAVALASVGLALLSPSVRRLTDVPSGAMAAPQLAGDPSASG